MNLAIFDLDGTLTDTNDIDTECFLAAWEELGLDCSGVEWSSFEHVTDSAIADALASRFDAMERTGVCERARSRFLELLAQSADERPAAFRPIAGAPDCLATLPRSGWAVAIATGAWSESARIKLKAASLSLSVPLSASDCCRTREEIVRHAIQLAETEHDCSFDRIVLLGDAIWDLTTAARLALPFVGVATGRQAAALSAAGATHLVRDYSDTAAILDALERATVSAG